MACFAISRVVCVCMFVCVCMGKRVSENVCVRVCVYMCVYVCIYVCVCALALYARCRGGGNEDSNERFEADLNLYLVPSDSSSRSLFVLRYLTQY